MTEDDVLFGYRLQLFALAAERGVSEACRLMGVHRSTYYRWKHQVGRSGLEMLRPRERRRPQMPNQLSPVVEQRIVAFCLGHPGLGLRRVAARLARREWGGLVVSPNGVYKALCRHGLNTRAKRLALVAGYRAPYEPPREPAPEPHIDTTVRESWSAWTASSSGACTAPRARSGKSPRSTPTQASLGPIWSSPQRPGRPSRTPQRSHAASRQTSSTPAGNSSASSPTTATSSAARPSAHSCPPASATPRSAPAARKPTATSNDCTAPSSKNAGDPPSRATSKSATAACDATSPATSTTTTTTATITDDTPPGNTPPTSSTVPAKWSRDEPHLSTQLGVCSA